MINSAQSITRPQVVLDPVQPQPQTAPVPSAISFQTGDVIQPPAPDLLANNSSSGNPRLDALEATGQRLESALTHQREVLRFLNQAPTTPSTTRDRASVQGEIESLQRGITINDLKIDREHLISEMDRGLRPGHRDALANLDSRIARHERYDRAISGQGATTPQANGYEAGYRQAGETTEGTPLTPFGGVSFDSDIVGYVAEISAQFPDLSIDSGYRSKPHNDGIPGAASDSDHTRARGVDFNREDLPVDQEVARLNEVRDWVNANIPGVWADVHGGAGREHLHVSFRGTPPYDPDVGTGGN